MKSNPDGWWSDKTEEDLLNILKDVLDKKVLTKEIQKLTDIKKNYGTLYVMLQRKTQYTPADCCRKLGYPQLVKSDKRHDIKSLQKRLGETTITITHSDIRMQNGRARTFIKFKCTCGYESDWLAANNIINAGTRCPRCSQKEHLTNAEHDRRLMYYYGDDVKRIDDIINAKTPIRHTCTIHNTIWASFPYSIAPRIGSRDKNSRGCNLCAQREPLTNEVVDQRLNYFHKGKIERISNAKDNHTAMQFSCTIDGYEWLTMPYNVAPPITATRAPRKCPKCSKRTKPTNEEHDARLLHWHGGTLARLEDIINARTPILHKCQIHNYSWHASPNKIAPPEDATEQDVTGCPYCANLRSALGLDVEKILHKILNTLFPDKVICGATKEIKEKSRSDGYCIEPDFMIGNQIWECKLSIGAVFIDNNSKTSQQKYSPYAEVIHVVFEPWRYMTNRIVKRGDCIIIHVSQLINLLQDKLIKDSIICEIIDILSRDERNIALHIIDKFTDLC